MTLFSADCRYYLARQTGPMQIELVDGCHGTPHDVAKAAVLHARIFGDRGPVLMVELHEVPNVDVTINEEAAETCRRLVAGEEPV